MDVQLAEINGIMPKVLLQDGEEKAVSSMTSNTRCIRGSGVLTSTVKRITKN